MNVTMSRKYADGKDCLPNLHEILKGEVASIQTYGAFIQLGGYEKQGLVHVSQISSSRVEDAKDVLEKGETIWCKVISVSDGKLGLSMKLVSQTSGKDLDPANVQLAQDEQRKKSGYRRENAPIHLEAVYDTKCRKCGGTGHIAQDCFHTPGGKTYELLEEEEKSIFAGPNQLVVEREKQAAKHKQKKDKHKKKKKHKHKSGHSSDSDSDSPKKTHHKKKKRKSSSRRDSSDSDEFTAYKRSKTDDGKHAHKRTKKDKHKKKRRHSSSSSD